jgi:hypothetical protein
VRTYGEAIDVRTVASGQGHGHGGGPGRGLGAGDASSSSLGIAPPAQFLWRGRLYLVREVLAHWVELGTWWSARGARAPRRPVLASGGAASGVASGSPSDAGTAGTGTAGTGAPGIASSTRSVAADVGAVEREVWRVEAAAGRTAVVGVYDLVRDVAATDPRGGPPRPDRWRLARALD